MIEQHSGWGTTPEGQPFSLFVVANPSLRLRLTNLGASIVSLEVPDRGGRFENVVVTPQFPADYCENPSYLGATIGRFANRIGGGKFWLDGNEYTLAVNNGPNHLHGGLRGFSHRLWQAEPLDDGVRFSLDSPDGDQGYPGRLLTTVTFRLEGHRLIIDYHARCDHPTVVNLTNHAYWNLAGRGSILGHELQLNADRYLEADEHVLVTGNILDVFGTPFDFRHPKSIGQEIDKTHGGYDHCFVINDWDESLRQAARVVERSSGRVMEVWTTEPGVQLYTANHFDGSSRSAGFGRHEAFCLECQHFPDSPNEEDFPSTALRPGDDYRQITEHRFSVVD